MSATRPTPETDAAIIAAKGVWTFELKKTMQRLERQRDEAHAVVAACMSAMPVGNIQTHTPKNLAARIGNLASALATETSENEAMCETMRETADILAQIPVAYDHRFFRAGQWANAALAKLQPYLHP